MAESEQLPVAVFRVAMMFLSRGKSVFSKYLLNLFYFILFAFVDDRSVVILKNSIRNSGSYLHALFQLFSTKRPRLIVILG